MPERLTKIINNCFSDYTKWLLFAFFPGFLRSQKTNHMTCFVFISAIIVSKLIKLVTYLKSLFGYLQDQFGDYDENEIKKIDSQISACSEKLKKLQETLKTQESGNDNCISFLNLPWCSIFKIRQLCCKGKPQT